MKILAIDLGTQSVRAGIVDINGKVESVSQLPQEVYNPHPGWAQQQPHIWWELTTQAIKDLLKKNKFDLNLIKAICTCGQMHGPVGIDNHGKITTKWTQIWMDKRCESICQQIRKEYDERELARITGNPITTGWPGVKVSWIKHYQPDIYDKTDVFLVPKDFINYQLTGVKATDPSEASGTYLYDFNKNHYSEKMADILQIELNKFAPISKSYESIGMIKDEIAATLGLPSNIPVFAGGGDFIVSLLGLGLVGGGAAVDMTGTSTLFVVQRDQPIVHPSIQNLKHVIEGWVPFTMLDCGGLSMKWCKDFLSSVAEEITYNAMIQMAENVPIGSEGLMFYPYLLGERRPENILTRGCFFGLNLNHKAAHFARAIMEGVALAIGKDFQKFKELGVNIQKVICVGGATRNNLLYKIKANVMQVPQILTDQPEASLRGNALLAAYGLGFIKDLANIPNQESTNNLIIQPNEATSRNYQELLKDFIKMYEHMLGYWHLS